VLFQLNLQDVKKKPVDVPAEIVDHEATDHEQVPNFKYCFLQPEKCTFSPQK
jgi:hypothetical protein